MSSQNGSRFQVRAGYALFVLGGFLLGLAVALAMVPDEPAMGQVAVAAIAAIAAHVAGSVSLRRGKRSEHASSSAG